MVAKIKDFVKKQSDWILYWSGVLIGMIISLWTLKRIIVSAIKEAIRG